jgi:Protein of unknown function (DUF2934)
MANKRVSENNVVTSTTAAAPARRRSANPKRTARPSSVETSNAFASQPEVPSAAPATVAAMASESFQDAVARLAYSYWEARGSQSGSPEADWLRAEQELRSGYTVK